jgi:hypothetical protein
MGTECPGPIKGLLEGRFAPIEKIDTWLAVLGESGPVGKHIRSDLLERFAETIDFSTIDGLKSAIVRDTYVVQAVVLGAARMSKWLYMATEPVPEDDRAIFRNGVAGLFLNAFPSHCQPCK